MSNGERRGRLGVTKRGSAHPVRRWLARGWAPSAIVLLTASSACVHDDANPGDPGGPSELGLSLTLTASPDMLPLDGTAQAVIGILARNASGETVPNVTLSLQIASSRGFEDFGRLSARRVVTGADGRAAVTYTAPSSSTGSARAADTGEVVTILVTPSGTDFGNTVSRALSIRLVPPGGVVPIFNATAGFSFVPVAPSVFNSVLFTTDCPDAASTDCVRDPSGLIASYRWNFGDGRSAVGATVSHSYDLAGTYVVTLTITDVYGRSAQATQSVSVSGGTPPTAVMSVSPTDPTVGATVFFNGSGSTAAPGRTIASHRWDFGDGDGGSGVTESHAYHLEGTYVATLNVTDDRGQVGTATAQIVVSKAGPTASFVFSPTEPTVTTTVFFDGHSSNPGPGRTIVTYRWNFGDGTGSSLAPNVDHRYTTAGTYDVQLKVTNDFGEVDTVSKQIVVTP